MTDQSPNYCQDPECHNRHVAWYADHYPNRSAADTRPWEPTGHWISWLEPMNLAGWRRWCRSHALLNEGVAFG